MDTANNPPILIFMRGRSAGAVRQRADLINHFGKSAPAWIGEAVVSGLGRPQERVRQEQVECVRYAAESLLE
jgi:hypothetical protein